MNSQPTVPAAPLPDPSNINGSSSAAPAAASPPLSYELVLPAEELEGIYDRIVRQEIKMRGGEDEAGQGGAAKARRPPQVRVSYNPPLHNKPTS